MVPSSRIRLVLFNPLLEVGGTEQKIERLALGLDRTRFEPIVAWSDRWGPIGDHLRVAGIQVVRLPVRAKQGGYDEALATVRGLKAHIFHSFNYRNDSADVSAARDAGVPVVLTGRVNIREWDPKYLVQGWELERNSQTDGITAVSEAAADVCAVVEGVPRGKITVIHGGVDIPELNGTRPAPWNDLPENAQVIGCVANYRPEKDHETLLAAFQRVVAQSSNTYLVCCGLDARGRKNSLCDMVRRLHLEHRVKLLESQEDVSALYRALDVYVHSSSHEGFANAILEAMAYGLAVVATKVGGTPEAVLDGVTGLLVPPKDPARLAEAILTLLNDPARRQMFGRNGRERAKQDFSLPAMLDAYARLYESFVPSAEIDKEASFAVQTVTQNSENAREHNAQTTVFVTTIGDEPHFSRCIEHLQAQSVARPVDIIDHQAPMSSALQQMIDRCKTPYYVQVDEDMMLFPNAIETLERMIEDSPATVAMICAYLWDCETQKAIQGVKIYRHAVVKQFPYRDTLSCEIEQIARMKAAGFTIKILPPGDQSACFGTHGGHYTPETIFKRWQRHFQKHHQIGNMKWIEPWPERLLERYLESRDVVHLYAFLGAVAGITSDAPPDRELDWREPNSALTSLKRYFLLDSNGSSKPGK